MHPDKLGGWLLGLGSDMIRRGGIPCMHLWILARVAASARPQVYPKCAPVTPCLCDAAILALCTSFDTLAKLVNCGILFVAALVASSVLLRRYLPAVGSGQKRAPVLIRYWVVVACSIGARSFACLQCKAKDTA